MGRGEEVGKGERVGRECGEKESGQRKRGEWHRIFFGTCVERIMNGLSSYFIRKIFYKILKGCSTRLVDMDNNTILRTFFCPALDITVTNTSY